MLFLIFPQNLKASQLLQLEELFLRPKLTSLSLELFKTISETNPRLLAECKSLMYKIAESNATKFSAMVGLILSQTALTMEVGGYNIDRI